MALIAGIPPAATQIAFASSTRGLAFTCAPEAACKGKGAIYRTSDGGLTWRKILSTGEPRVLVVDSAPSVVAWLTSGRSTTSARHLHVQIGRASTTVVTVGPRLAKVAFRAAHDAWGITDRGAFLTTANGGRTWSSIPANPCGSLKPTAVRPVTAAIGLVVCSGNAVYRTKDGGRHWKRMTRRAGTGTPRELDRSPDGRLWLALPHSLKVSTDLGVHWRARTELGTGASAPRSLSFPGLKTGYLTRLCTDGTSDLVRSNDRGTTWHEQPRAAGPCQL